MVDHFRHVASRKVPADGLLEKENRWKNCLLGTCPFRDPAPDRSDLNFNVCLEHRTIIMSMLSDRNRTCLHQKKRSDVSPKK